MSETDLEFIPLPCYGWSERPSTVPLDYDECATALYLAWGHIPRAARLLRVDEVRFQRQIRRSPRLQALRDELYAVYADRAAGKVIDALDAEDSRVQWAAALKILSSRSAEGHPFSPSSAGSSSTGSVTINNQEITFHWRTEPLPLDNGDKVIENSFDEENKSPSG